MQLTTDSLSLLLSLFLFVFHSIIQFCVSFLEMLRLQRYLNQSNKIRDKLLHVRNDDEIAGSSKAQTQLKLAPDGSGTVTIVRKHREVKSPTQYRECRETKGSLF